MTREDIVAANPDFEYGPERKILRCSAMDFTHIKSGVSGVVMWFGEYTTAMTKEAFRRPKARQAAAGRLKIENKAAA